MKHTKLVMLLIMVLILSACGDSATHDNDTNQPLAEYTCPMHPHYISTDADGSCPICGMGLVPVSNNSNSNTEVIEDVSISVSETMIQTMGVRTSAAEVIEFGRTLRAFGTVEADQRLENVSVSRLEGWIDKLKVRAQGDAVLNGDLLYRVYSPDLIAAQRDYLSALTSGNKKRIQSVKQRLLSIGMQEQPLQQLRKGKTVINNVPVYAETDGIVASLDIRNGDYVKPGTPIMRLQSYDKVWVIASIPETDLPLIDRGISASLRFPSAPKAPSTGIVDYIYPTIDPKTRTAKVRIELDNANGDLQPGAYADITLGFAKQARLSIVSEAILRDSRGDHIILALGDGRFAARTVTTGITAEGRTEILSGLRSGDLVVASGQFMLDSEVNLREGLSKLSAPITAELTPVEMQMSEPANISKTSLADLQIDATSLAQIDHFIDMALYFHETLISGGSIQVNFVDPAIELADLLAEQYQKSELVPILQQSKQALIAAQVGAENQALAVALASLMQAMKPWILDAAPAHYANEGLTLYRDLGTGQLWLQKDGAGENPYGEGESVTLAWPKSSRGPALEGIEKPEANLEPQAEQTVDPHAGHR
jgi:Cu(I)/Ag(I) efflux system membrane fusion protein